MIRSGFIIDSTELQLMNELEGVIHWGTVHGTSDVYNVHGLEPGHYAVSAKVFSMGSILARNYCSGFLSGGETAVVSVGVQIACSGPMLRMKWPREPLNSFLVFADFEINPDSNSLKRYPFRNLDSIAAIYRASSKCFYRKDPVNRDILDEDLIPLVTYTFGKHRNPVTTCHTAAAFYEDYMDSGDPASLKGFRNNANWILENCDSIYYLRYGFSYKHWGEYLHEGWVSGMAQGMGLNVLSRAYDLFGDRKYLEGASGIFKTLYRNSGRNICFGVDQEDYYWLEEYPNEKFCHVLNGKVAGLWGLWSYYCVTHDRFARHLFEAGIKTLVDNYPLWNVADYDSSHYCLHHAAIPHYNGVHKEQMRFLGDYFRVKELTDAAACFENRHFAAYPERIEIGSLDTVTEFLVLSGYDWTAESAQDWVRLERIDEKLSISCTRNPEGTARTADIRIFESDTNELKMLSVVQSPAPVSVLDRTTGEGIRIYPNPASEKLKILLPGKATVIYSLEIFDPGGRQVLRTRKTGPMAEIGIAALPSGIYILRITSGREHYFCKLIIE